MKRFAFVLACAVPVASAALGAEAGVSVTGATSRPATGTAVVYATLRNDGSTADRLVGASSTAASSVGLHQSYTTATSGSAMGGMPMAGMPADQPMVGMRSVPAIPVPAHGIVTLRPGGYHLMLRLRRPIRPGDAIVVRWHFALAGWISTRIVVPPMP